MPLRPGAPLPALDGAVRWINGEAARDDLLGQPTFVQFWALSCPICKENMPIIRRWRSDLVSVGVRFVAIHSPRLPSDTDEQSVAAAAIELGIAEPCAIDAHGVLAERFGVGALWPYYFLFDEQGHLKRRAAGAVGLRLVQAAFEQLRQASSPLPQPPMDAGA